VVVSGILVLTTVTILLLLSPVVVVEWVELVNTVANKKITRDYNYDCDGDVSNSCNGDDVITNNSYYMA